MARCQRRSVLSCWIQSVVSCEEFSHNKKVPKSSFINRKPVKIIPAFLNLCLVLDALHWSEGFQTISENTSASMILLLQNGFHPNLADLLLFFQ